MINEIKWSNDSQLNDFHLDLKNANGKTANTVIFIGENGSKKTTVLKNIASFLSSASMGNVCFVKYILNGSEYVLTDEKEKEYIDSLDESEREAYSELECSEQTYYQKRYDLEEHDIRTMPYIYSEAGSGFSTTDVKAASEEFNEESLTSYADVKQCFVDLYQKTLIKAYKAMRKENSFNYSEFIKDTELGRLQNALDYIFDGKIRFDRTEKGYDNSYEVFFVKDDKELYLEDLSSGEQQIIFRAMNILQQVLDKNNNQRFVFIDEPELSLHPRWEKKILQFYRNLFTDNRSGEQSVQLFIATHSELIVQEAVKDSENVKVIILENDRGHVIQKSMQERALNIITGAEINYLAFGTISSDYFLQLFGELHNYLNSQNSNGGNNSIKNFDNFLCQHTRFLDEQRKVDDVPNRNYNTLPVYIRNAIDHPESGRMYNYEELEKATKFLREIYIYEKNRSTMAGNSPGMQS